MLLAAIADQMPEDVRILVESIGGIPLYDGDDESANGIPPAVARLKDAIAASDGLLLVTPEYNNSMPGVAKNALDWLSRPPADSKRVFAGKAAALAGTTPGAFGTVLSQGAWLPVFRTLGAELWPGRLMAPRAETVFAANGQIRDDTTLKAVRNFALGLAQFVRVRNTEPRG